MIKIGIDPSGSGTTGIVALENNKIIRKIEIINKNWLKQLEFIIDSFSEFIFRYQNSYEINIENCLPTNANGSKDRDDLLRLLGALEIKLNEINKLKININWVSPKHTKSIVKKIEYKSKFLKDHPHLNDNFGDIKIGWAKDARLFYEFGKGWKYNNEKISHHIRDAIIIAHYESKNNA